MQDIRERTVKHELCATAVAHPNIAFIKYWGNQNNRLRLPANGSISMNLRGLETRTAIIFRPSFQQDEVWLNGQAADERTRERVISHLDLLRNRAEMVWKARVDSRNNFPMGTGIASSASAYAALTLAAATALKLALSEKELSALARRGSGSACRSIPAGFVEWYPAATDQDSFAESISPPEAWDLIDLIAVISSEHKDFPSTEGNKLADTSTLQPARVRDCERRLTMCREAIRKKDFSTLAEVMEEDTCLLHAIMLTSHPALFYLQGPTLDLLRAIPAWRAEGMQVAFSVDAGPNVHCICPRADADALDSRLRAFPGVQTVLRSEVGGPAIVVAD